MLRRTRQNLCATNHSFTTMQVNTFWCQTHATIRQCNYDLSYSHLAQAEKFLLCSLVVHSLTFHVRSVNEYIKMFLFNGLLFYWCPND